MRQSSWTSGLSVTDVDGFGFHRRSPDGVRACRVRGRRWGLWTGRLFPGGTLNMPPPAASSPRRRPCFDWRCRRCVAPPTTCAEPPGDQRVGQFHAQRLIGLVFDQPRDSRESLGISFTEMSPSAMPSNGSRETGRIVPRTSRDEATGAMGRGARRAPPPTRSPDQPAISAPRSLDKTTPWLHPSRILWFRFAARWSGFRAKRTLSPFATPVQVNQISKLCQG